MKYITGVLLCLFLLVGCQSERKKTPNPSQLVPSAVVAKKQTKTAEIKPRKLNLLNLNTESIRLVKSDSLVLDSLTYYRQLSLLVDNDTLWQSMNKTLSYHMPIYPFSHESEWYMYDGDYCSACCGKKKKIGSHYDYPTDSAMCAAYLNKDDYYKKEEGITTKEQLCQSPAVQYGFFYRDEFPKIGRFNLDSHLLEGYLIDKSDIPFIETPNNDTLYYTQTITPLYRILSEKPLKIAVHMLYEKQAPHLLWLHKEYDLMQIMEDYFPMHTLKTDTIGSAVVANFIPVDAPDIEGYTMYHNLPITTQAMHPLYEYSFERDSVITQLGFVDRFYDENLNFNPSQEESLLGSYFKQNNIHFIGDYLNIFINEKFMPHRNPIEALNGFLSID